MPIEFGMPAGRSSHAATAHYIPLQEKLAREDNERSAGIARASTPQEPVSFVDEDAHASLGERVNREAPARLISATPFTWIDPSQIPTRKWLYGRHMIRAYASATVASGGVGKSSLLIAEALAIATGRNLLGILPTERTNVWIWNGEDPLDELQRRIAAMVLHFNIDPSELGGRLFVDTGRKQKIVLAETGRDGTKIAEPVEQQIITEIREKSIGLLIIDPFVSSHRVSENDNNAIDAVAKAWAGIADVTNCAIELVHHVRKTNGSEATTEDSRGASALIAAVRSARVLNPMSKEEADRADVENRRLYFRMENGKANLAPPSDKADWFRLASVDLGNGAEGAGGDNVGAVERWEWPSAFDGITLQDLQRVQKRIADGEWRQDSQAASWAGNAVAEVLGLDSEDKAAKDRIKRLLATWIANGALKVVTRQTPKREAKKFIEVGEPAI